jgi:hypothetical protein
MLGWDFQVTNLPARHVVSTATHNPRPLDPAERRFMVILETLRPTVPRLQNGDGLKAVLPDASVNQI